LVRTELPQPEAQQITDQINAWRKSTIFRLESPVAGEKLLFETWLCRWNNRVCSAKYVPITKELTFGQR